jgi:cyclopropane-fatty-acyl-phospholipid synthase
MSRPISLSHGAKVERLDAPDVSVRPSSPASTRLDRWALGQIQRTVACARIRVVLWDGFELLPAVDPAIATILFRNRAALLKWVWDAELNFGEAYVAGDVEIRGGLLAALVEIYRAWPRAQPRHWGLWHTANGARAARENVHRHYDLGNDFYRLWLDRK